MKALYFSLNLIFFICYLFSQTNPIAQSLPYTENFSLFWNSTTYPAGIQGWAISTSPGASFDVAPPVDDRDLNASRDASTSGGGVHNYNGKIGFLNSGTGDLSIVFSVNTSGKQNIFVSYRIMTIRNPYGYLGYNRINEVTLQYRVGESGSFANLTGVEYQNNTTTQVYTTTTPQQPLDKSVILPAICNNQPIVQLRLASREVSGSGYRPSFAIDNISVTGDILLPIELSSFTVTLDPHNHPQLTWVTQSETGVLGFYVLRADANDLSNAQVVSPLIQATNTSQQQTYVYTDADPSDNGTYYYWLQNSDFDGSSSFHGPVTVLYDSSGGVPPPDIPLKTELKGVYPNPFNPLLFIPYSLAAPENVSFGIYNSRGQLVRSIDPGSQTPGEHVLQWDGTDARGQSLAGGIYCIRMQAGQDILQCKAVLQK